MTTPAENLTLKIVTDPTPSSPREAENLGTLATWHRRYTLGDVQPKEDPLDYQAGLPENSLIVPVYLMDHSGLALSIRDFGDKWDSGQVGIYHVSPAQMVEAYGADTPELRETAMKVIASEVAEYSDYVNGNCWGYEVLNGQGQQVDSGWGFFGSDVVENGLVDHLSSEYLPLLAGAVVASDGATCDPAKLAEWVAQVEAAQAVGRKAGPRP